MKKIIINILIVVLLMKLSGCATILFRQECLSNDGFGEWAKIYPATLFNCGFIYICCTEGAPMFGGNMYLLSPPFILANTIDLPISITSDTLFLPLDVYRWNCPKKPDEIQKQQNQEQEHEQEELKTNQPEN